MINKLLESISLHADKYPILPSLNEENATIKTVISRLIEEIAKNAAEMTNAASRDDRFFSFVTVLTGMIIPAVFITRHEGRPIAKIACVAFLALVGCPLIYQAGLFGSGMARTFLKNSNDHIINRIISDIATTVLRAATTALIGVPTNLIAMKLLGMRAGAQLPPLVINIPPIMIPIALQDAFQQMRRSARNTLCNLATTV